MSQAQRIVKNFVWLSIAELATKGISFFNNAYLARVILTDGYGQINFALATVTYFVTFVTLGLNVIGAGEIARNPQNKTFLVNTIISIRLVLAAIALLVYFSFIFINSFSPNQTIILIIASLNIISAALTIDWYYQGIEKMEILAIRQLLIAIVNLIGIISFVHTQEDTKNAIIIISLSTFINTIFLLIPYFKEKNKFNFNFDVSVIKTFIKKAIPISLSQIFLVFLSNSSIILIGLLLTNPESKLGIYTAANKLMVLLFLPVTILQIVFYPYFAKSEQIVERQRAYEKYLTVNIVIGVFLSLFFYLYADIAIKIVYGDLYNQSIDLLKLMMIIVLMSYISQTAIHPLIAWKKERKVFKITFLASLLNIILNIFFILHYELLGAIFANILTEIFILLLFLRQLKKNILRYPYLQVLKIFGVGAITILLSIVIFKYEFPKIINIISTIFTYFFVILATKVITIEEIKGYLKR